MLDAAGGRTVGADTARFDSDHPLWSATPDGLAPDGSTFLAVADAEQRGLVVVSVADGSVQSVHASSTFELDGAWAGDSTGVFFADGDLRFWSRADGSVVSLADEVTTVRAVSTRHPATSPICEHVGAIVESFAAMRTGAEIGAPSRRVLDGLRMFAPDALADDTAALVTFVDSFVSAERTDSERIENWPANVTAGIEAIERFDDTDC